MRSLAALPVAIPLTSAAVILIIRSLLSRRATDLLSIGAAVATLLCSLALMAENPHIFWFGGWHPRDGFPVGIAFFVDGASALLAGLAALLSTASFVYSWHYFPDAGSRFHVLMLLFLAGMTGFALTGDLFDQFVFFELMSVAAFALTGYKLDTPSLEGAITFTVTNSLGGFFLLFGIALLYGHTGALNMYYVGRVLAGAPPNPLVLIALALLATGYLVKGAIAPFHFWLPEAHAVAPTPVCVLFSGIMVQLGLFGFARVAWIIFMPAEHAMIERFGSGLVVMGAATALVGGIMALLQRHLKRLLAFSTVSHGGVVLMGIGLMEPVAFAGSLLYVIAHGLIKGALFMGAGNLLHRHGSIDEIELSGRGRDMPRTAFIFIAGALGLSGLAPFGTFLGKALIEEPASRLGLEWVSPFTIIASGLTGAAVLRAAMRIFFGLGHQPDEIKTAASPHETQEEAPDRGTFVIMNTTAISLIALALFGFLQESATTLAAQAAQAFTGVSAAPRLTSRESLYATFVALALTIGGAFLAVAATRLAPLTSRIPGFNPAIAWLRRIHLGPIGEFTVWLCTGFVLLSAVALWSAA